MTPRLGMPVVHAMLKRRQARSTVMPSGFTCSGYFSVKIGNGVLANPAHMLLTFFWGRELKRKFEGLFAQPLVAAASLDSFWMLGKEKTWASGRSSEIKSCVRHFWFERHFSFQQDKYCIGKSFKIISIKPRSPLCATIGSLFQPFKILVAHDDSLHHSPVLVAQMQPAGSQTLIGHITRSSRSWQATRRSKLAC